MKATGSPQKLRFTIHSCTGEDPDFPVRELLFHSPQTRGWQTPRLCTYPQELVIRLEQVCKVQQLQILSHEFKIASKVEVFVSSPGDENGSAAPKRLGYLSFDSNERSNHQARELKSVHVNVMAYIIRLVFHRCHVNKLNIYNQVGVIALNLIGEPHSPAPAEPIGFLQLHPPANGEQTYYNSAAADVADLNLDIHVDPITASKIRELARLKDSAVAKEDYDEAKRLKASIDRLRVLGQKVAQLEARKRAAVEREDYDTAKAIKADIDRLRGSGGEAAVGLTEGDRQGDAYSRAMGRQSSAGRSPPPMNIDDMPIRPSLPSGDDGEAIIVEDDMPGPVRSSLENVGGPRSTSMSGQARNYDDRPAVARGRYTPSDEQAVAALAARQGGGQSVIDEETVGENGAAPPGWPSELPGPEEIPGSVAKDAEPIEELAGKYLAAAFFSKNWQLRDAALVHLGNQLREGEYATSKEAFRVLLRTIVRGMKDKVANVFHSSLSLLQTLVDMMAPHVGGKEIASAAETVLPILIDKLGESNIRLREASREMIMFLVAVPDANLRNQTSVFLKPVKNQSAWRPVLGVLTVLEDLVPLIGISKSGDGFDLPELMEYLGKAYSSPNAEVRTQAVKVTGVVHDLVGPACKKLLPREINAKIKEALDAVFEEGSPAPLPPPIPAPTRAPPPQSNRSQGGANPSARPPPAPRAPTTPPRPPTAEAVAPDDPAPFIDELHYREATFGPDHPDVAESASNLAILYNQKGEFELAQPLYERALEIYENHYGPDHPEVAHTLTDLAVLYLEQGHDELGRPLLERALAIQEKALGPDHPDVIAIQDVLNS